MRFRMNEELLEASFSMRFVPYQRNALDQWKESLRPLGFQVIAYPLWGNSGFVLETLLDALKSVISLHFTENFSYKDSGSSSFKISSFQQ
jgi:hypothetical protein